MRTVKKNQKGLFETLETRFTEQRFSPQPTPHTHIMTRERNRGRREIRVLDCRDASPQQVGFPGVQSIARRRRRVRRKGKKTTEIVYLISRLTLEESERHKVLGVTPPPADLMLEAALATQGESFQDTMATALNGEEWMAVLERLAAALPPDGPPLRLCLIGSAACLFAGMAGRTSGDLDIWKPASDYDRLELKTAAEEAGLLFDPKTALEPETPYLQLVEPGLTQLGSFEPVFLDRLGRLHLYRPPVLSAARVSRVFTCLGSVTHVETNERVIEHKQARPFYRAGFQRGEKQADGHGRQFRFVEYLVVIGDGGECGPRRLRNKAWHSQALGVPGEIAVSVTNKLDAHFGVKIMQKLCGTRSQCGGGELEGCVETIHTNLEVLLFVRVEPVLWLLLNPAPFGKEGGVARNFHAVIGKHPLDQQPEQVNPSVAVLSGIVEAE